MNTQAMLQCYTTQLASDLSHHQKQSTKGERRNLWPLKQHPRYSSSLSNKHRGGAGGSEKRQGSHSESEQNLAIINKVTSNKGLDRRIHIPA